MRKGKHGEAEEYLGDDELNVGYGGGEWLLQGLLQGLEQSRGYRGTKRLNRAALILGLILENFRQE